MSPPINQVERFGKPTWRRLVEAVEDDVGAKNPALALTIAGDHPGASGIIIYNYNSLLQAYIEDQV